MHWQRRLLFVIGGGVVGLTAVGLALVVLGMVAYFAEVVQAPIMAFVIVGKMTNDHALILPLMLTSVIAYTASRLVCSEDVYHALAHNFIASAISTPPNCQQES